MNEISRQRLQLLKEQQKQKITQARMRLERERIIETIPSFAEHYRLADKRDVDKVNAFLSQLPALTSVRLDLSQFSVTKNLRSFTDIQEAKEQVWICFLCGSRELMEIIPYGELRHFVLDFSSWQEISSYFILVYHNFNDFIFIDDNKRIVQSFLHENIGK